VGTLPLVIPTGSDTGCSPQEGQGSAESGPTGNLHGEGRSSYWKRFCVHNLNHTDGGGLYVMRSFHVHCVKYVGMLISLWLFLFSIFLFAAQSKEFFLDGLMKLEQRSHKCVELRGGGIFRLNTFS
jgi:hypothetical protein